MINEFFEINRISVLFVYGLTFYTMGVAILLQYRKHSRIRLARELKWLALFGILHGVHEWGQIFIPLQKSYLVPEIINFLELFQVLLLVVSFACLLQFGVEISGKARSIVIMMVYAWAVITLLLAYRLHTSTDMLALSSALARYFLCVPGGMLAAYGLRKHTLEDISPLNARYINRLMHIMSFSLFAYAIFAGVLVRPANFWPANSINSRLIENILPVPVELWRSLCGFVLMIVIIRVLELFNAEINRIIENMEIEQIRSAERERIGQEIHDGAMQGIYSASLILQSIVPHLGANTEADLRVQQAKHVLDAVNKDLRSYMQSLREIMPIESLSNSLHQIANDPRFKGLLDIEVRCSAEPQYLQPMQVNHLLGIVQECLANIVRHAQAQHAVLMVDESNYVLTLRIQDDGCGFAPEESHTGYGIRSMRDRARILGGQLNIDSTPGQGTRVILILNRVNSS